jgi:pilus assembly protein Flp/PilA
VKHNPAVADGERRAGEPSPTWRTDMLKFLRNEEGVTAIEYGLIAALVAVVIIGAVTALGTGVSNTFNTVAGSL